jgi:hypothetical protein
VRGIAAGGGWCGAELLARDGGPGADAAATAYVGNNWQDSFEIEAVTQRPPVGAYHGAVRTMSMCLWGAGRRVLKGDAGQSLGGLAVHDRVVVAAVTSQNKLLVIRDEPKPDGPKPGFGLRHGDPTVPDHRSGVKVAEVPLDAPRGMVVTADGRHLLAISGQRVVRFSFPPQGEPTVLVGEGLEKPQHLALDGDGNLYVSDQGPHQVLVFDREGRRLRIIGVPGGPKLGPYDERRMANPRGIAISADRRLWVAENSFHPRRISIWNVDGTFVKSLYGNNNYGGGGMVDAGDPNRGYVSEHGGTLQLHLDGERGVSRVEAILALPGKGVAAPLIAQHVSVGRLMGHAVSHQGRRYLSNAYCTAAGGGNHSDHTITLWKVDDESQKSVPVASVGEAQAWGVLKQPEFATRWPAGVDPKGEPRANFALYAWSDLNDNGTPDPDEVQMVSKPEWKTRGNPGTVTLGEDLAIVDCLGNRYRPVQFTKAGAPQYDLTKSDSIFPTAQPTGTTGGGQVIDGGNGWAVTTWSPEGIPGGYVAGAKDGVVRWRYPARVGNGQRPLLQLLCVDCGHHQLDTPTAQRHGVIAAIDLPVGNGHADVGFTELSGLTVAFKTWIALPHRDHAVKPGHRRGMVTTLQAVHDADAEEQVAGIRALLVAQLAMLAAPLKIGRGERRVVEHVGRIAAELGRREGVEQSEPDLPVDLAATPRIFDRFAHPVAKLQQFLHPGQRLDRVS